jgi:hypothetical protein
MITEQELDRLLETWDAPAPPPSLRRSLVASLPPRRRKWRWFALAAVAIPVAVATSVYDPSGRLGSEASGGGGGVYVKAAPFVSPPTSAWHWWRSGIRFSIGSGRGMAAVYDHRDNYYGFGYAIQRQANGDFEVAVAPLDPKRLDRGTIVPLPATPSPAMVADGGAVDVEVYRSGEEHVYIRLEVASQPFAGMFQEVPLGNGQVRLAEPRLTVSGAEAGADRSTATGATVWVRVPGHAGRYLIALDAMGNPNFTPNGSVRGKTLEFQIGAERIRIDCARPISTHDAPLYVWHDEAFDRVETISGSAGPACYFNGACLQGQ